MSDLISVKNLKKQYRMEGGLQTILDVSHFAIAPGEQKLLVGQSGCGKSTFLHILSGLVAPSEGEVFYEKVSIFSMSEANRDKLRATEMGLIFQKLHLLPSLTALENVYAGTVFGKGGDMERAKEILVRLGLEHRFHHQIDQLSIGQAQRVAVARALVHGPKIVFADEPTGSLDPNSSRIALNYIRSECERLNAALLIVSHDEKIISEFDEVVLFDELVCQ